MKYALDVNVKLPIIRSGQEVKKAPPTAALNKKSLNIPIGDVLTDPDYDTRVSSTYILTSSFVRHTKKIGDEPDITIDYCMEDEDLNWMQTNPRFTQDLDLLAYLTVEIFEKLITFLEKSTGFSAELIPLVHAEKLIIEKFKWSPIIATKIVPEIHQYWIKKRERCGKPLCRKYWTPTPSSDTNPHHVFRPRDKERYRLRKQQRKNDVEAYRKMQQLRREFGKARELLQLIVERESLHEANILTRQDLLELEILEIDDQDHFQLKSKYDNSTIESIINQHKYKLQFPSLLDTTPIVPLSSEASITNKTSSSSNSSSYSNIKSSGNHDKLNMILNKHQQHIKSNTATGSAGGGGGGGGGGQKAFTNDMNIASAMDGTSGGSGGIWLGDDIDDNNNNNKDKKKDRKQQKRKSMGGSTATTTTTTIPTTTSTTTTNISPDTTTPSSIDPLTTALPYNIVLLQPNTPGPAHWCRPLWPSFLDNYSNSETTTSSVHRNYIDYLEELELKHPLRHTQHGISGVSRDSHVFRVKKKGHIKTTQGGNCYDDDDEEVYTDSDTENNNHPSLSTTTHMTAANGVHVTAAPTTNITTHTTIPDSNTATTTAATTHQATQNTQPQPHHPHSHSMMYPMKYRSRGRIGRGGRVVIDRIPIYEDDKKYSTDFHHFPHKSTSTTAGHTISHGTNATSNHISTHSHISKYTTKWIYASQLPPPLKLHRGPGTEFIPTVTTTSNSQISYTSSGGSSSSNGNTVTSNMNSMNVTNKHTSGYTSHDVINPSSTTTTSTKTYTSYLHPIMAPMSYTSLPPSFITKEQEIYTCSDSEDEKVEYIKPYKYKTKPEDPMKSDIYQKQMQSRYTIRV